jgi:hypothetical protein
MTQLVLVCGDSPLPVWMAALTLKATDVVLLHGDGASVKVAQAISAALAARRIKVGTFAVPPFDPAETQRRLGEHADRLLAGRSLVYGPGTTAMNVAAYAAWLPANIDHVDTDAWWPESRTGTLHSLMGRKVSFVASDLDLRSIANLHDPQVSLSRGMNLIHRGAGLGDGELLELSELIDRWLSDPSLSTAEASEALPSSLRDLAGTSEDSGWLLELAVGMLLLRWFGDAGTPPEEISLNVVARVGGRAIAEFDVAVRWGERVLCVTCGKAPTYNTLRQKLFEADTRGPQVFGRETRTLTVAHAREDIERVWAGGRNSLSGIWQQRRRSIGVAWDTRPRHAMVAARELFGPKPSTCLSQPGSIFDQRNGGVGQWLLGCTTR